MDTSPITGENGMCSCKITADNDGKISMFPNSISSPNCNTGIQLTDTSFTFGCQSGQIGFQSYYKDYTSGDILWLFVITTVNSDQSLSGSLQIKTESIQGGPSTPMISVECYQPNTKFNSSSPTTLKSTKGFYGTTRANTKPSIGETTSSSTAAISVSTASASHTQMTYLVSCCAGGDSTSSSSSSTSSSTTNRSLTSKECHEASKVAAIAAGVTGCLGLILVIVVAVTCFRYGRSLGRKENQTGVPVSETHPAYSGVTSTTRVYDHSFGLKNIYRLQYGNEDFSAILYTYVRSYVNGFCFQFCIAID